MGGPPGKGGPGGDDDDEPPNLKTICRTDGLGKIATFYTDPWTMKKKRWVVSFFFFLCGVMLTYRVVTDTIPQEKTLALYIAFIFAILGVFFIITKQKRPEAAADEPDAVDETSVAFKMSMDLSISKGDVVMVIGSVGCGKSSFIQALLGEMSCTAGKVEFASNSRVSYCSQQAWLMNATLKENITFINDLDEKRYQQVLDLVNLRQDLNELPLGDRTEIGERGINLSGGQKARVSIARAMYNDADIYILDDVLSALDAHVGKHVFDHCVGELRAAGKTVIMATNQLHVLPKSDMVIFLKHDDETKEGHVSTHTIPTATWSQGIALIDCLCV